MLPSSNILEPGISTPIGIGDWFVNKMFTFIIVAVHSSPLLSHNSGTADRHRWRAMHSVLEAAIIHLWQFRCWQCFAGVEICCLESSTVGSVTVSVADFSDRPICDLLYCAWVSAESCTASWRRKRFVALFKFCTPLSGGIPFEHNGDL